MGIDPTTDFYDNNHTNILGAEKYTRFLANYIDAEYDLPDRSLDPAYAQWHDGCETWETLSGNTKHAIEELIAQQEAKADP